MTTVRSASWAPRLPRSASETASTDSIPSSKQARTIRTAISPRLAISTRRSRPMPAVSSLRIDDDDRLPELDRPPVLHEDRRHHTVDRRSHMVHQLHHLDDRHSLASRDRLSRPPQTEAAPGEGARQNNPTDGDSILVPFSGASDPAAEAPAPSEAVPPAGGTVGGTAPEEALATGRGGGSPAVTGPAGGTADAGAPAPGGNGSRDTCSRSSPTVTIISRQSLPSNASSNALIVSGVISICRALLAGERSDPDR